MLENKSSPHLLDLLKLITRKTHEPERTRQKGTELCPINFLS